MYAEEKKSVNENLYERASGLFWGFLIGSWILCNWRPIFFAFSDDPEAKESKLTVIMKNYADINHLIYYPLLCTVAMMILVPLMTNTIFLILLRFSNWRAKQKNAAATDAGTTSQFNEVMQKLRSFETGYEKLIAAKDGEIAKLQEHIYSIEKRNIEMRSPFTIGNEQSEHGQLFVKMDKPEAYTL
jgi:hypothetical protein